MLQISTGKFFRPVELRETSHRAVFYTNYRSFQAQKITTPVATLDLSTAASPLPTITCQTIERLEAIRPSGEPEIMYSTGGKALLDDLAAVISFGLDVTCTRNPSLTERLIGDEPKHQRKDRPANFIHRTFDAEIFHQEEDEARLANFLEKLVALERDAYEHAIRAIRRYVLGMHRIVDEMSLSYTLFVMSIESLMHKEKPGRLTWREINSDRKAAIDKVLKDAPDALASEIREAVLKHEKPSIGPRFVEFALSHTTASFFRDEAEASVRPISKLDLRKALKLAYEYRSRYVHSLREIPKSLSLNNDKSDTGWVEGHSGLTFQGLTRLARHIILEFIERGPSRETEGFDYRKALPNIVILPVAPQYWIWRAEGYNSKAADVTPSFPPAGIRAGRLFCA